MAAETITFKGLAAVRAVLPSGDAVVASLHGGQVLSWVPADGGERLFLSDKTVFGGDAAVRGGVPVCFPQFNQRGPLPKHGFARQALWTLAASHDDGFELLLRDGLATQHIWPEHFELRLRVQLAPQVLTLTLNVRNTGPRAWPFTAALHTYLRTRDVTQVTLAGLSGTPCWDAVADQRFVEDSAQLHFGQLAQQGFDRVFTVASDGCEAKALTLQHEHGHPRMWITQSDTMHEAVVWNPGQAGCAQLADMAPEAWRHMLCVEAARIDQPVTLGAGESWQGWQQLRFEP
jgi:glucose-6-phosphate 1-epimerase